MKSPKKHRSLFTVVCALALAIVFALPFAAQQPRSSSAIGPIGMLKPEPTSIQNEKLIPLPPVSKDEKNRGRRANDVLPSLSEEQKILHLLNRAGFGPRTGDIERVRQMGLENYLDQQLHPENLNDEFLARPLAAFTTQQMTLPEALQFFAPPPVRPAPTPTPTPPPLPTLASKDETEKMEKDNPGKGEMPSKLEKVEMTAGQNPKDAMPAPAQNQMPQATQPAPTPTPAPRRDPQQPLRELQQTKLLRAVFSEKQLQEVMVDFWFNHFNVFAGKDNARLMVTSFERDVIRPHALGNFKELLVAVAQNPAMLYYLDNFLSQAEKKEVETRGQGEGGTSGTSLQSPGLLVSPSPTPPPRRPGLNENYARELMELHTLGVDGGYTQQDVIEVARCFTGWTVIPQPNTAFVFRPRTHDKLEKTVIGTRLPAGGGIEDGLRVLDLLARHPSTARFISYKLCQRFVADDPPGTLVYRAADVFTRTNGDLREVVKTILTSPEFYAPKYYRNKIKSPLELAASAIRATSGATDGSQPLIQWVSRMGEPLYLCQPPTGYSEDSSRWMSNATLLERMNFAVTLVNNKINGTRIDLTRLTRLTSLTPPDASKDKKRELNQIIASLVHSDVSDETRDNLARVFDESRNKLTPAKYDARANQRNNEELISGLVALILGSREFQVK